MYLLGVGLSNKMNLETDFSQEDDKLRLGFCSNIAVAQKKAGKRNKIQRKVISTANKEVDGINSEDRSGQIVPGESGGKNPKQ